MTIQNYSKRIALFLILFFTGKTQAAILTNPRAASISALKSTELYNPSTHSWTLGANMNVARGDHTSIRLLDGRILVVGGLGIQGQSLKSAEIYNPTTGHWTLTSTPHSGRWLHSMTLLTDGRVLVVGGSEFQLGQATAPISETEIYDPLTNLWSSAGNLNQTRELFGLATLKDGRVLAMGGRFLSEDSNVTNSVEIYDPLTNLWRTTTPMHWARSNFRAHVLSSGEVWVGGGYSYDYLSATAGIETFDLTHESWNVRQTLFEARADYYSFNLEAPTFDIVGIAAVGGIKTLDLSCRQGLTSAELSNDFEPFELPNLAKGVIAASSAILNNNALMIMGGGYYQYCNSGFVAQKLVQRLNNPQAATLGLWLRDSSLNQARYASSAENLPNRRIIIIGGFSN